MLVVVEQDSLLADHFQQDEKLGTLELELLVLMPLDPASQDH